MHVDSSVYITIARGISRGYLPYRDFVDNKGPFAYLISAPGFLLGKFTGVWITELVLMFVSVLFAYKTALFFGEKKEALPGTVFGFVVLIVFFTVSAGTEEYSLPFLMISLFIFSRYYFSPERNANFCEPVVLGSCFACAVMIRLNMFSFWAGFCTVIFFEELLKRRFLRLFKYISAFCFGLLIIFIPVYLYLKINGIMEDFLEQVIFGGAAKGFSGGGLKEIVKNIYIVLNRNLSMIPVIAGVFWMITKFRRTGNNFYTGYIFSFFLTVLFLSFSSGDNHYNMVLIPFFIPALTFFVSLAYSAFSDIKAKKTFVILFFCLVFSEGLVEYFYDFSRIAFDRSGSKLFKAGKMIDENTKPGDKIISLGFNAYIYPFTQRDAASKFIYQGSGLNRINGAREKFLSDILTGKPAVIALFNDEDGISQIMNDWHGPVFEMIENEYRLLSDENGFLLYINK